MKRITIEEAKQYIPCEEDYVSKGIETADFFTLTPIENGWEKVTYYTARKVNMYANRGGDYDSWVYVLSNASQPGLLKIGYTKNTPDERAKQISNATGVPIPYKVEWAFHCYDGFGLEQEVHHKLGEYRVNNNREFFQISLEEAKASVKELGERYL
tara:strand:+ start:357 stop:824 length:468 start_codon:yes stop_codon:yes gene_type:complete